MTREIRRLTALTGCVLCGDNAATAVHFFCPEPEWKQAYQFSLPVIPFLVCDRHIDTAKQSPEAVTAALSRLLAVPP